MEESNLKKKHESISKPIQEQLRRQAKIHTYRVIYKKQKAIITSALKSAPPPPEYIPNNVCASECNVCYKRWFDNTITMFECQCKNLRLCPMCADENTEPEWHEHNMIDCNVEYEWGGEDVDWDEEIVPTWADSLSKNIFESITLEIGNPIDDGNNYIKQVITSNELNKS